MYVSLKERTIRQVYGVWLEQTAAALACEEHVVTIAGAASRKMLISSDLHDSFLALNFPSKGCSVPASGSVMLSRAAVLRW